MKKSLLALAALTAFAGVASAQSSVTLFGIVDMAARNVKNGSAGSIKSLSNDGNASSRLGVRGIEDLGGGMRAGFWLEGTLAPDIGNQGAGNGIGSPQQTSLWNRRSTVSLLGGFGEVRLGRDFIPTFWNHTNYDPFGTNGVGAMSNLIADAPFGNAVLRTRSNNSIGYFLPAMGGLFGQFMISAGENQVPGNKYMGGRLGYAAGPLNVAVGYGKTEKAGAMIDDMTVFQVGGSYNFGTVTAMVQYNQYEEGFREITHWLLGANIKVGPGTFKVSYNSIDTVQANRTKPGANQLALGYVYDMSKRTALYTHFSRLKNDNGLRLTASGSGPAAPTGVGFTSTGYEFGVRHSF